MLGTFSAASKYIHFKNKPVSIDNFAFKCHYRATFLILLVASILVTSRQYIGEHIRCITGSDAVPENVMNTFCFFTTTFTIIRHLNESLLHAKVIPHPGIGPMYQEDPVTHHAYYQWVPFVLFGQCLMFYLTHLLWKKMEGGKLKTLVDGLHMIALSKYVEKDDIIMKNSKIPSMTSINSKIKLIKKAFYWHVRANPNWGYKLTFCEILNFLHVILQIYITDMFLGGKFLSLGIDFINDDFKGEMDVLDIVFPKVTKCHFYKYGASGSIQKHDALCVMALNVINEKVYIFLWFWYCILLVVSFLAVIWRLITVCYHATSTRFNRFVYSTIDRRFNPWDVLVVTRQYSLSDWLFLYYIGVNLEPYIFRKLFLEIAEEIRTPTITSSEDDETFELNDMNSDDKKSPYAPLQQNLQEMENEMPKKLEIDTVDSGQHNLIDINTESESEKPQSGKEKHVKFA
uniref:Innexin n=1 Tax=Culicoides sonorensis TaxID=179676 RepID=A0A336MRI1_CULSO